MIYTMISVITTSINHSHWLYCSKVNPINYRWPHRTATNLQQQPLITAITQNVTIHAYLHQLPTTINHHQPPSTATDNCIHWPPSTLSTRISVTTTSINHSHWEYFSIIYHNQLLLTTSDGHQPTVATTYHHNHTKYKTRCLSQPNNHHQPPLTTLYTNHHLPKKTTLRPTPITQPSSLNYHWQSH